jgi:tetratricopeptide (TPR) repeat protein
VLRDQGELAESERLHRAVVARTRGRYGETHPRTLVAKQLLAMVLDRRAEYAEAEALAREILAEGRRLYGDTHLTTATWMLLLGGILLDRGNLHESAVLLQAGLPIVRRSLESAAESGDALYRLAYIAVKTGRPEAAAAYREAVAFYWSRPPDDPDFVTDGFHFLAWTMLRNGDYVDAERVYRDALILYRLALPPGHPYLLATLHGLGAVLRVLGRHAEAEEYLREAATSHR